MVTITLYAKQKKRHRCTEQTFGLCGRRRGWDVLRKLPTLSTYDMFMRVTSCKKCTTLMGDIDSKGSYECLGPGRLWKIPVPPSQFCCEP